MHFDYTDMVPELKYDNSAFEDDEKMIIEDAELTDAGCASDVGSEGDDRPLSRDPMDVDNVEKPQMEILFMLQMDAARHKNMKLDQGNHTTIIVLRNADLFNGIKS